MGKHSKIKGYRNMIDLTGYSSGIVIYNGHAVVANWDSTDWDILHHNIPDDTQYIPVLSALGYITGKGINNIQQQILGICGPEYIHASDIDIPCRLWTFGNGIEVITFDRWN